VIYFSFCRASNVKQSCYIFLPQRVAHCLLSSVIVVVVVVVVVVVAQLCAHACASFSVSVLLRSSNLEAISFMYKIF
jgi:hypothetical protein